MSFHAYAVATLSESHGWMEFNSSPTSTLSNYSNYCSTKHLRLEGYLTDMHLQTRWFVGCWQGFGAGGWWGGGGGRRAGGHVKYTRWTDRVWIRSSLLWQQGLLLCDLLLLHPRHPGQQPAVAMATGTERTQTQTMWVSLLFRQARVLLRFDLKKQIVNIGTDRCWPLTRLLWHLSFSGTKWKRSFYVQQFHRLTLWKHAESFRWLNVALGWNKSERDVGLIENSGNWIKAWPCMHYWNRNMQMHRSCSGNAKKAWSLSFHVFYKKEFYTFCMCEAQTSVAHITQPSTQPAVIKETNWFALY